MKLTQLRNQNRSEKKLSRVTSGCAGQSVSNEADDPQAVQAIFDSHCSREAQQGGSAKMLSVTEEVRGS